jgi:hypothetical protein
MYVRWQSRKRQQPEYGLYAGKVCDRNGKPVRNKRGSILHLRRRADGSLGQDVTWTAILVEALRIDGQPRQRHVASLASITESRLEGKGSNHGRRYFWDDVYERLDQLGNRISIDDRRRIEQALALKVPRLSEAEHEASVKMCAETTGWEQKPYRPPA